MNSKVLSHKTSVYPNYISVFAMLGELFNWRVSEASKTLFRCTECKICDVYLEVTTFSSVGILLCKVGGVRPQPLGQPAKLGQPRKRALWLLFSFLSSTALLL